MITTHSPYFDPEFLKSINVVPFDPEADENAMLQRQAVYRFHAAQEREERRNLWRGLGFGFVFSAIAFVVIYLACCL